MPEMTSLDELNERIKAWEEADENRRIGENLHTVGQALERERPLLNPLPFEAFDPGLVLTPRVDRSSMVMVRMVKYSVPARFIGRKMRVSLRASELVIFDGRTRVARHERIPARTGQSVQLDHYLEVLKTKPGAFPGSTALARAREAGAFTKAHDAFWSAARHINGDADGTRELIDVLLLHRSMDTADIEAGIRSALSVGAISADVVAVEARRHGTKRATDLALGGANDARHVVAQTPVNVQRVISLTQRRLTDPAAVIAGLPADKRPLPSVNAYDELLTKRRTPTNESASKTASREDAS